MKNRDALASLLLKTNDLGVLGRELDVDNVNDLADFMDINGVCAVVRCKECKHRGTDICPMRLNELSWYEGKHGVRGTYMQTKDETCSDGFCHKGER